MKKICFKNNKGFTLTELIVVIAIMAILTSVSIYSLNQISSGRARKATNELVALLAECKIDALAGAEQKAYLQIYLDGDDLYGCLYEGKGGTNTKVKENLLGTNVSCKVKINGTSYAIGTYQAFIGFERATGAFQSMTNFDGNPADGDLEAITITAGRFTYTIEVVAATGYYSIR